MCISNGFCPLLPEFVCYFHVFKYNSQIPLQQLQNFLPQQIQTITSADGQPVQVAQATNGTPTTPIKQERLFVTPQMQPQVLNLQNLQGIPQQFIQVNITLLFL